MDFDAFLEDPQGFVQGLTQTTNETPDLGLKNMIQAYLEENPEDIEKIPLILTKNDILDKNPGQLVRIRCIIDGSINSCLSPLIFLVDGERRTSILFNQEIPETSNYDVETEVLCQAFSFRTIPYLSNWVLQKHKTVNPFLSNETLKEESVEIFKGIFLFYDESDMPMNEPIDVICCINEGNDVAYSYYNETELLESLQTYTALAYLPSIAFSSLTEYIPEYESMQMELFLLWLVSSVRTRIDNYPHGTFSLGFSHFPRSFIEPLLAWLREATPAVSYIQLENEGLIDITPQTVDDIPGDSPLMLMNGTRVVVDEINFDFPDSNEISHSNAETIQKLIHGQILQRNYNGTMIDFQVSYPVLLLTQKKTCFKCEALVPFESSFMDELPDPMDVRGFIEEKMKEQIDVNPSDIAKLAEYLEENGSENGHLLMTLFELSNLIFEANIEHTIELFEWIMTFQCL